MTDVTRDLVKYVKPDPDLLLAAAGPYRVFANPADLLTPIDEVSGRR